MRTRTVPAELTLLAAKDIAKSAGMSVNTVYGLMRSNTFPTIKIGGRYYVSQGAYSKWLKDHQNCKLII